MTKQTYNNAQPSSLHHATSLKPLKISRFFFSHFVNFVQMISDEVREQLQNIIRGTCLERATDRCSAIRNLLIESFGASPTAKGEFESRLIVKEV
jgi:hypothetical protein